LSSPDGPPDLSALQPVALRMGLGFCHRAPQGAALPLRKSVGGFWCTGGCKAKVQVYISARHETGLQPAPAAAKPDVPPVPNSIDEP
jgi:hypothetical protein